MSEPLRLRTVVEGRTVHLTVSGELTYATAPLFQGHVAQVLAPSRPFLVVDLEGVTFSDSVGLSALIGARRRAGTVGGDVTLCGVRGPLRRCLQITGADTLFTIDASDAREAQA